MTGYERCILARLKKKTQKEQFDFFFNQIAVDELFVCWCLQMIAFSFYLNIVQKHFFFFSEIAVRFRPTEVQPALFAHFYGLFIVTVGTYF